MASRTELKATFSGGNQVSESDFALLIDSLAHLSDDKANGDIIGQSDLTSIQTTMSQLQALAQLAKDTADGVPNDHPTFNQMQTADNQIKAETLASVKIDTDAVKAVNDAQQIQITNLESNLNTTTTNLTQDINSLLANQVSVGSKADLTYVNTLKASTDSDIAGKAPLVHEHAQYATKVSIANSGYITLADVPPAAQPLHQHNASDINGLDALFTSPAEVDQKIEAAKNTLDNVSQLYDIFYDKEEVDQKFYVARWRTDQISLFNPSVVSIAQPLVDIAKTTLEVSIGNVRAEEVAKDNSVRSLIASTRAEIEVSINNTNSTVESNRVTALSERGVLQNNIDTVQSNATASIASSQANVLNQLSNVRAEILIETQNNTNAIAQAETDANTYTDTKISDLINGAGAAYNTLKELEDHLIANESSAATALTTQVGILQGNISANDTELANLQTWVHGLAGDNTPSSPFPIMNGILPRLAGVDAQITTIQNTQVSFQNDLGNFQTTFDSLTSSNTALTTAYNSLLARVTTLENTAYAQAGYTFP